MKYQILAVFIFKGSAIFDSLLRKLHNRTISNRFRSGLCLSFGIQLEIGMKTFFTIMDLNSDMKTCDQVTRFHTLSKQFHMFHVPKLLPKVGM